MSWCSNRKTLPAMNMIDVIRRRMMMGGKGEEAISVTWKAQTRWLWSNNGGPVYEYYRNNSSCASAIPLKEGHSYEVCFAAASWNNHLVTADADMMYTGLLLANRVLGTFTAAAGQAYLCVTVETPYVEDVYIKDTTTGKYLYKGNNV